MPLSGARTYENVGGALRAAISLGDKTVRVAAGTAPPTFIKLFSSEPAMTKAIIAGALRTPIGKFLGALRSLSAVDLGASVVKALVEKYGLPVAQVEEIIMGNVVSAGLGQNPARQADCEAD